MTSDGRLVFGLVELLVPFYLYACKMSPTLSTQITKCIIWAIGSKYKVSMSLWHHWCKDRHTRERHITR